MTLDAQTYFESIDADTERMLAMGALGLEAPVPCCPGWTVADVLSHVAMVYEHKVRVMADNGWPTPWPPDEFADRAPVDFLAEAKAHLFAEFAEHTLTEETTTFSADDTTIGFWARRMALEAAIHRYDAEVAHGQATTIPTELALDGIDEVLRVTLGGPWWEARVTTEHPIDDTIAVAAEGQRWFCSINAKSVSITREAPTSAAATVSGSAEPVFRWLWGRAGDDEVEILGDATAASEFRARLVECTG